MSALWLVSPVHVSLFPRSGSSDRSAPQPAPEGLRCSTSAPSQTRAKRKPPVSRQTAQECARPGRPCTVGTHRTCVTRATRLRLCLKRVHIHRTQRTRCAACCDLIPTGITFKTIVVVLTGVPGGTGATAAAVDVGAAGGSGRLHPASRVCLVIGVLCLRRFVSFIE